MASSALHRAKKVKRDEFYTQLEDVEKELDHYREYFEGKVIYLNCDDPRWSNFWKYFTSNFDLFGLKKLIATYYVSDGGSSYKYEYEHKNDANDPIVVKTKLKGDGDFRSEECVELLKESDVVITNPPFSLWREYVAQLVEYEKKFIIIGNMNAVTYKEVFPLLKNNEIWFGHQPMSSQLLFEVPDDYEYEIVDDGGRKLKSINATWYTNLEVNKCHERLVLTRFYEGNEESYPKYDNYDVIEVGRVKDIPMDYDGVMGVPITFMGKHNPEQFEILGMTDRQNTSGLRIKKYTYEDTLQYNDLNAGLVLEISEPLKNKTYYEIDDKIYRAVYKRILIVNKKPVKKYEV